MSTKDRLAKKKYMGVWRCGSELMARMMSTFPIKVTRYIHRKIPKSNCRCSGEPGIPRRKNSEILVWFSMTAAPGRQEESQNAGFLLELCLCCLSNFPTPKSPFYFIFIPNLDFISNLTILLSFLLMNIIAFFLSSLFPLVNLLYRNDSFRESLGIFSFSLTKFWSTSAALYQCHHFQQHGYMRRWR